MKAADGVALVHVGDFVAEDEGQFIFGFEDGEKAAADDHVAAGKCVGVDEVRIVFDAEGVMDAGAQDVGSERLAHLGNVIADLDEFGRVVRASRHADVVAHLRADAHFFLIADLRGFEREALGFAFGIGDEIESGGGSDGSGDFVALEEKENGAAGYEDGDECDAARHQRTFLSNSRWRA